MITLKLTKSPNARAAVVAVVAPSDKLKATGVEKRLLTRLRFEGKAGQSATVTGDAPAVTVLAGVGPSVDVTTTGIRKAVAGAVRSLSSHRTVVVDLSLLDLALIDADLSADDVAQAAAEGAGLAGYQYAGYKSRPRTPRSRPSRSSCRAAAKPASPVVSPSSSRCASPAIWSTSRAARSRRPASPISPPSAAVLPASSVEVLDLAAIEEQKLGGLLSVAAGRSRSRVS